MKQFFSYLGASLAAIAALASCNKEIEAPVEDLKGGVPFEICASADDTKTAIDGFATSWVADDAINLFHAVAGSKNYTSDGKFTITSENLATNKFTGNLPNQLGAGNYDWYAFYPYSKYNLTPAGSSQSDFGFTTIGGTSQTQTGNNSTAHLCGKPCPLYGIATGIASNVAPSITMNHLTSIIEVNVTNNSGEDLTVSSVSFTGTEDIVGTYYINFTETPVVYTSKDNTSVSNTVSLNVADGEAIAAGSSAKFYIAIKPFTVSSGTLKVAVNGYEKEIEISNETVFTAGKIKKINFNYDNTAVVKSVTFDFSDPQSLGLTKPSTSAGTNITSDIVVGDVTLTTTDGGTATRIWNSKGTCDLRVYKSGGSLSFSVPDGSVITRIVFAGDAASSGYSASVGTLKSGTWTGSNQNVKFTATNNLEISTAVVTYSAGKANTSIISDDITGISARGGSAIESSYTIENPVDGTTISATCDETVVTAVEAEDGTILYTVSANTTTSVREGSITLTYGDVTKVIKVSQLAPVFKLSRTEVELEAAANSSSDITVTSDFDWYSDTSAGAGFTSTPTTCEWTDDSYASAKGKKTVTIKASDANASKEGTKTLGTLTFTNYVTEQVLEVTVTQKTSYVAPSTGTEVPFNLAYTATDTKSADWSITNESVTLYWQKGTSQNTPSPNKEGSVRMYPGTILTITVPEGKQITKVVFTATRTSYNATKLSYNNKALTSDTWKLATPANSVDLTATANARFKSIVVTYN